MDYRPARDLGCDALPPVLRCDLTPFLVHRTGRYKLIRDVVRDAGQLVSDTKLVTVVEFSTKKPYLSCMITWDIVVCMQHGDVGLFLQV